MNRTVLIQVSPAELRQIVVEALHQHDKEKQQNESLQGTVSINKAAKMLGVAHASVKKLIREKQLKTTADQRRVTYQAINDYLGNK